jgi:hypothetical protein
MAIPSGLWQLLASGGPKFWTTPTSGCEAADAGTASPKVMAAANSNISRRMVLPSLVELTQFESLDAIFATAVGCRQRCVQPLRALT